MTDEDEPKIVSLDDYRKKKEGDKPIVIEESVRINFSKEGWSEICELQKAMLVSLGKEVPSDIEIGEMMVAALQMFKWFCRTHAEGNRVAAVKLKENSDFFERQAGAKYDVLGVWGIGES